ncbi:hypothetical protein [Streptomyces ortus]|uniref:Transcriptional regulator n=1 Tax=Streptomyces ortus TaxID=2867268 RepID=A0ABT3VFY4_9ACTN|nr:hypothetical protein [Streptomyces ortus]MCX4238859.1 hypothetical protein [Streptomyces ortus]
MKRPNTQLSQYLAEAGWSCAELARHVNELGREQGTTLSYDRTTVAHWLRGSRPRPPVPLLVAQALSRRIGRLIHAADTGLLPDEGHETVPDGPVPTVVEPVELLLELCRTETDPARRAGLARAPYHLLDPSPLRWPRGVAPDGLRIREPSALRSANQSDAEMLERVWSMFSDLVERYGAGRLTPVLTAYLEENAVRCLTETVPPELACRLRSETAHLTALVAEMHLDMRRQGVAQLYHHITLSLARSADDRTAYAVVLCRMARQALELRHLEHGLRFAEGAVEAAGTGVPLPVRALVLSERAVARAANGDRTGVAADMRGAQSCVLGSDQGHRLVPNPSALLHQQRSRMHEALGHRSCAISSLQSCLRVRDDKGSRSYVLLQAELARLCLRIGHVEQACSYAEAVVDRCDQFASVSVQHSLSRLRKQLRGLSRHSSALAVSRRIDAASLV